jgi:hypothetical protein
VGNANPLLYWLLWGQAMISEIQLTLRDLNNKFSAFLSQQGSKHTVLNLPMALHS